MSEFKEFVNSNDDFYAILGLEMGAEDAAINTAYRQASKKYHPDKVGPDDTVAAAKLQLVQRARGVLLDKELRPLYDNTRNARAQVKAQQAAMSDKRREMVERLEKAEQAGAKRKREEKDEQQKTEERKAYIAQVYEERLRQHQARMQEPTATPEAELPAAKAEDGQPSDEDRMVKFMFLQDDSTSHLDKTYLQQQFAQFGEIDTVVLLPKRCKPPGEKHRKDYVSATMVFKSILGALRAVQGFGELRATNERLSAIDEVTRFRAKEEKSEVKNSEEKRVAQQQRPHQPGEKRAMPKFSFSSKTNSIVS